MMLAACRPAMLKVLLGAVQVTECRRNSSFSEANGMWRWPSSVRSQWISSDMTVTPCRRQIFPRRVSSSAVQARPAGLWGLHRKISLACGSGRLALQIFEVHAVGAAFVDERIGERLTAGTLQYGEETVVNGRLKDYLVARFGQGLQDDRKGGNDARSREDPLVFDAESVPFAEPPFYGFEIGVGDLRIAENAVAEPSFQGVEYGRGRAEIHVGHPHRQHPFVCGQIPFDGVGTPSRNNLVEIVFHNSKVFDYR